MNSSDGDRTAVQLLIANAEGTISILDNVLLEPNPEVAIRAIRNGHRAYKEIAISSRVLVLTPVDIAALERLLGNMKQRLRFLKRRACMNLSYGERTCL